METSNGQEAYDRFNDEAIDEEERRYQEWRNRNFARIALEQPHEEFNSLAHGQYMGEMGL